jgi:hypothetical protein
VTDPGRIADIARAALSVAVLGIKPEDRADQPAHFVAAYMQARNSACARVCVYAFGVSGMTNERATSYLPNPPAGRRRAHRPRAHLLP